MAPFDIRAESFGTVAAFGPSPPRRDALVKGSRAYQPRVTLG